MSITTALTTALAQLGPLLAGTFGGWQQKHGIHNDVIARHPELEPGLIASALRTYTRSVGY